MAKCKKCGQEYPNGTEHVCLQESWTTSQEGSSQPEEGESEADTSSEETFF